MKNKFVTQLAVDVANELGLQIQLEENWGYAGVITLKDGTRRYFNNTHLDINSSAAAEVAKDKSYTLFFLSKLGYKTPISQTFYTPLYAEFLGSEDSFKAASIYADKLGYPLIVKPNGGFRGEGVAKVTKNFDLENAIKAACVKEDIFLVQEFIVGDEYRLCVLDNELVLAYQKSPLTVVGDGVSPVDFLISEKINVLQEKNPKFQLNFDDVKINLQEQNTTLSTVLDKESSIRLSSIANLSQGGEVIPLNQAQIHPSWKNFAVKLCSDAGLRFCGIDIITTSDYKDTLNKPVVLEINSAPGFYHYSTLGELEFETVTEIYKTAFRKMCS